MDMQDNSESKGHSQEGSSKPSSPHCRATSPSLSLWTLQVKEDTPTPTSGLCLQGGQAVPSWT